MRGSGSRAAVLVAVAAVAAVLGAAATAGLQDRDRPPTTTTSTAPALPTTEALPPGPDVLLAWAQGGLPDAAVDAARAAPGVVAVAVVRDGRADLLGSADADGTVVDAVDPGWAIALDAAAVDPAAYAEVVAAADRAAILDLGPGEAILSETSAELRRLDVGGRLEMAGGTELTVVAVVPDTSVGAAEVVVDTATGDAIGARTPRAALVAHSGDRPAIEAAVAAAAGGTPVRFRAPGETPYLRAADAVLPQAIIKAAYGEFAHRPVGDGTRDVEIDPSWVAAAIVEVDVPGIGPVRCHRAVIERIVAALAAADGLGYDGCYVPRFVRPGGSLSRHAWGVAVDLGFGENPTGTNPVHSDELVDAFHDVGFAWGGTWLVPDAAHYEVVDPRAPHE